MMSSDTEKQEIVQHTHQRRIQRSCSLRFNDIRRSASCRILEEQLDLPATLVEGGDGDRRQCGVVGQKDQRLARLWIVEANARQMIRVVLRRVEAVEHDALIADD